MRELAIWMEGERVGQLVEYGPNDLSIIYDVNYVASPRATPLSLSMPLTATEHRTSAVASYLQGLLPDNKDVIERWARDRGERPSDLFGLIRAVGTDVPGAAIYLPPEEEPDITGTNTPLSEREIAEMLERIGADQSTWHSSRYRERWSLAGAQSKIALAHDPKRGWSVPGGAAATTHILKPAIRTFSDQDLDEIICMKAAKHLGLRSARTDVGRFGDVRVILSTRYDRVVGDDGDVLRIHQEDFCQALGIHPDLKYQADGGPTPAQQFSLLHRRSTDVAADVALLRDAFAFNWLILGTDAHAKNHSLILRGRRVQMAPLYDVASLAPYTSYPPKAKLAQKIGGEYRAGRIGEHHWIRFASESAIDPDATLQRVRTLAQQIPDAINDAVKTLDITRAEDEAARRLSKSIISWTGQCQSEIGPPHVAPNPAPATSGPRKPQDRAPKGRPSGGQFLSTPRPEPDVSLDEEDD